MFNELANEENFIYVKSEKLRNRLKNAQPYLTHDGRVPTMIDLIEIFEGIQPVNSLYTKSEEISEELRSEFAEALASTFRWVGTQNITNNKETWNDLKNTKSIKNVEEEELLKMAQAILIGESVPTEETVRFVLSKYKECPMVVGYRSLVDQPLPKKIEKLHSKLLEIVHP